MHKFWIEWAVPILGGSYWTASFFFLLERCNHGMVLIFMQDPAYYCFHKVE